MLSADGTGASGTRDTPTLPQEGRKLLLMMVAHWRGRLALGVGALAPVSAIVFGISSYYFLTKVFRGSDAVLARYGGDVMGFIVTGLAMSQLLKHALLSPFMTLVAAYNGRNLQRVLMGPTSAYVYLGSHIAAGFAHEALLAAGYLLAGAIVFGLGPPAWPGRLASAVAALLILALGTVATLGLGMLATLLFFRTRLGKTGGGVLPAVLLTFSNTFTGVLFPVEVLPGWLQALSWALPQTHAIVAVRLVLAGGGAEGAAVVRHAVLLTLFVLVLLPVGRLAMDRGFDRLRHEGYTPRATRFLVSS